MSTDPTEICGADPEIADATVAVAWAARELLAADKGFRLAALVNRERAALADAVDRLEALLKLRQEEEAAPTPPEGRWEAVTWRDVRGGDRVRLPLGEGGYAEADVFYANTQEWVKSGRRVTRVVLSHAPDSPYDMKPSGAVEVWRPEVPAGLAALGAVVIGVEEIPS